MTSYTYTTSAAFRKMLAEIRSINFSRLEVTRYLALPVAINPAYWIPIKVKIYCTDKTA
jgi:hypothetical protein